MAESGISPKLQQIEKLFEWYLEPLDIIHLIHDTRIFEPSKIRFDLLNSNAFATNNFIYQRVKFCNVSVGTLIHRVTEMDDEGRKRRVQIFNEEWLERYISDSPLQLQQLIDIFKKGIFQPFNL